MPFVLSARSPESFRALWLAWREFVATPAFAAAPLADMPGHCGLWARGFRASSGRFGAPVRYDLCCALAEGASRAGAPHGLRLGCCCRRNSAQCWPKRSARGAVARARPIAIDASTAAWSAIADEATGIARFDRPGGRMHLPGTLDAAYLARAPDDPVDITCCGQDQFVAQRREIGSIEGPGQMHTPARSIEARNARRFIRDRGPCRCRSVDGNRPHAGPAQQAERFGQRCTLFHLQQQPRRTSDASGRRRLLRKRAAQIILAGDQSGPTVLQSRAPEAAVPRMSARDARRSPATREVAPGQPQGAEALRRARRQHERQARRSSVARSSRARRPRRSHGHWCRRSRSS